MNIWFYFKFFLKGNYINNFKRFKISRKTWVGKNVSIFFEKSGGPNQSIELGECVRVGHFSELSVGFNNKLIIKDFTTLNTNCKIIGDVTIERYSLLSANVMISSGDHYTTKFPFLLIRQQDEKILSDPKGLMSHSRAVHIEEDVLIGFGVYIRYGVTIGRGSVIGANSVVLNDIPPYEIHGGLPARKIKNRLDFTPQTKVDANVDEDLPYFYRGFDHLRVDSNNPSRKSGIFSYKDSTVAISFPENSILCQGFLYGLKEITLGISIDNHFLGKFLIKGPIFEFEIFVPSEIRVKEKKANLLSFLNFATENNETLCFGFNRIESK